MTKVSFLPTTVSKSLTVGDEGKTKTESMTTDKEEEIYPESVFQFQNPGWCVLSCYAISIIILSPACFTTSVAALSSTIVECNQGSWSLWDVCFLVNTNKSAPIPEFTRYCKYFHSAPGFIQVSRIALLVFTLLRSADIPSLLIFCYSNSWSARIVKVFLELVTAVFIHITMGVFYSAYPTFLEDELTGCHISGNFWIAYWPYVCIPGQNMIACGWALYLTHQYVKSLDAEEDCPDCNSDIVPAENDNGISVLQNVCTESKENIV